ncbi:MAG: hypothetical protein PHE55_22430, partial [Methylococcaceae bacterium]|nr:hypothetical protein [Methylococcaceae bacterium]
MSKSSYIPQTDGDFLIWHNHFTSHLIEQRTALGLSEEDVAAIVADNQNLNAKFAAASHAAATAKQSTTEKTACRKETEAHTRVLVRRIKAGPVYNKALGTLMCIEGPEDTTDPSAMKPDLTAKDLGGGKTELSFHKFKSGGVNIYSKREGEADFSFLARCAISPHIDSRPLLVAGKAETRKYKAVYVRGDDEFGQPSDQINVACS